MATVRNETEFKAAITARQPEIFVENDINLTTPTTIGYTVSITGGPGVSLFWANPTPGRLTMLIISAAGDVTIGSLILDAEGRNGTLVHVNGGKFTMNDGAVLKNITSRAAQNAVTVGDLVSPVGGTFIMNGGLITGVDSSDAVFCGGGTVVMNNDAAIDNNISAGITMTDTMQGGVRPSLTMTGKSRVSNNQSKQGGSAGIIMAADIVMGVNEGDAPVVTGNRDPIFAIGGWILMDHTNLTMRYGAEISDNNTIQYGGGLAAQTGSTVTMRDDAVIRNNRCGGFGAGVILAANSTITMEDRAQICGNVSAGRSGGLELQSGSTLRMKGNAAIHGNTAVNGAGLYLNGASAVIGEDNSQPEIYNNQAANQGGGVFISTTSRLDLTGTARVADNTATQGKGIYKRGVLNLSQSPQVSDGLFFDDLVRMRSAGSAPVQSGGADVAVEFRVPLYSPEPLLRKALFTAEENAADENANAAQDLPASAALATAYSGNVPVIAAALTDNASIQLEASGYVSPPNAPLVIADKGAAYAQLEEPDRAAWLIPQEFIPGHIVVLNDALDQVLIDLEAFSITYDGLSGADNPNPDSYKLSDLPLALLDPGLRPGYVFAGWYDAEGQRITEIPEGTTGNLTITAIWEKLFLSFDPNGECVCNVPKAMPVEQGKAVIPSNVPCRPCYKFICWNVPESGSGQVYFPGDTIVIPDSSVTLYAQWQPDCCRCNEPVKKSSTKCIVSWE